ncbi:hypothetical protein FD754_025010, partial [Muntiacus muntjak]
MGGSFCACWVEDLSICSTVARNSGPHGSKAQDSGFVPVDGIRGDSVLFHVIKKQNADPEEVSWGFGPESNYRVLLRVRHGADTPTWVSLQDKYQQRVQVPSLMSLRIENLTLEDSGQYRARASFTGGIELTQVFHLTVGGKFLRRQVRWSGIPISLRIYHRGQLCGSLKIFSLLFFGIGM